MSFRIFLTTSADRKVGDLEQFEGDWCRACIPPMSVSNGVGLRQVAAELCEAFRSRGLRRISLTALGSAAPIATLVAAEQPKLVRRVILIDPVLREDSSFASKLLDRAERCLPFGLPFAAPNSRLAFRSALHRVRCPVLVVASGKTGQTCSESVADLSARVPNLWFREIALEQIDFPFGPELSELHDEFETVPTKRPWK